MNAIRPISWPALILVAAVALHAAMLPSLRMGYLDPLFRDSDHVPRGVDFYSVYQSGDAILDGRSVYEWPPPPDTVPSSFPYRYPPAVAYTAALPFQALSPQHAYWLWVALIELMLVLNATLTFRLAADRKWGLVAAAMWFAFAPLYVELYVGQWSFLMATLLLATIALALRGRTLASAAPWMASIAIKGNTAILAPIYARLRAWRTLAAAAGAVVLVNAPYFAARPHDVRRFWDANFGDYWTDPPNRIAAFDSGNLGLQAFIERLWLQIDGDALDAPTWLSAIIVASIVTTSLAATFLSKHVDLIGMFTVWVAAYFLVYGEVWEHHYVMLLPVLAVLVASGHALRPIALAGFALVALPTPYALFELGWGGQTADAPHFATELWWPDWMAITYHALKALPVLVLWGAACGSLLRPRSAAV